MTKRSDSELYRRRRFLKLLSSSAAMGALSACGGGGDAAPEAQPVATPAPTTPPANTAPVATSPATTPPETTPVESTQPQPDPAPAPQPAPEPAPEPTPEPAPQLKSAKRGIAYDVPSAGDLSALSPGVSWWYNWGRKPHAAIPADYAARYRMEYLPMLWNGDFNAAETEAFIRASGVKYLLLLNEPNLYDQATMEPAQAAALWPRYEAIAASTGVKLVGPQITWGTVAAFADPVVWLDGFYAAYRAANNGRDPRIDYLGFHWYDYGLAGQLDRLKKYGKQFWVTEMANWHRGDGDAQIDTLVKQKREMTAMVALCEERDDVFRYAWFIGRWSPDPHFTSLLGADGQLTELGQLYVSLPFKA